MIYGEFRGGKKSQSCSFCIPRSGKRGIISKRRITRDVAQHSMMWWYPYSLVLQGVITVVSVCYKCVLSSNQINFIYEAQNHNRITSAGFNPASPWIFLGVTFSYNVLHRHWSSQLNRCMLHAGFNICSLDRPCSWWQCCQRTNYFRMLWHCLKEVQRYR